MEYDRDLINMMKYCTPGEELEVYLSKLKRIAKIEEINTQSITKVSESMHKI